MSLHWKGFGLAAVEGMTTGKLVVASDVSGLVEAVKEADILFSIEDANALAFHIKYLMNDPLYCQQIDGQCLQRAAEYNIWKTVDAYEKV